MTTNHLDRLAAYAPTPAQLADEWGPHERAERLAIVLDDDATGPGRRLRFRPRAGAARTRVLAPVAASVAVLAVAATIALVAERDDGGAPDPAGGSTTGTSAPVFRATVATPRVGAHQWAYRAVTAYDTSPTTNGVGRNSAAWVARSGSGERLDHDGGTLSCRPVAAVRHPDLEAPTQAFVDTLPGRPGPLEDYLVKHVEGSTSREEAVFTAVGDLLREGDLFASSAQRAAMVTVLAGLGRTSVHDDLDERGRSAVRVDFTDPGQRGGEIQSLYFDRHTFQLLEERSSTGPAAPTDAPSAPYTSVPSTHAATPQQLPARGSVVVVSAERVVDALPRGCGVAK